MKVQVEEVSPIERNLTIEVEPEKVEEELARAYVQLGRQVKVAGFRSGKIPRRILEQRYRQDVETDVVRRVVERAYFAAIDEHKVDAVGQPQVTPTPLKAGVPYSFQARVEVKPKLDPKSYKDLALKPVDATVDEAKVAERLESMRNRMGELKPVEGRDVAQAKDFAIVDYDGTRDGQPFAGGKAENITVEVAPGELVESNIGVLEGVKVGESKELDYTFPADYQVEELRGQTAHFKVLLKSLKIQVTPELNDDFAKEVGGGNTLEELRQKVRTDLEASAKLQAQQEEREGLLNQLIEKNAFEVPKAMVERAVDYMLEGALRNIARSGIDPRQLGLDFNRLRGEMRERAVREVKGSLLLEAIAQKENVEATDADVDARIETMATENKQAGAQVRKQFRDADERRGLSLRLREEKTIELLKASAKKA